MADYSTETEASAIAAFVLAQLAFWHQINSGALSREKAAEMLKQAVGANASGGPANQLAAQRLQTVLDMVQRDQRPPAH
jgi:hypothetical protein